MNLFIFLVGLTLLTCEIPLQAVGAPGDAKAGKPIYDAKCTRCHGAKGEGNVAVGNVMGVKFRHLGSKPVQAKSDEQLAKDATKGTDKIQKPITDITDQQIQDVVAFLRTLKTS